MDRLGADRAAADLHRAIGDDLVRVHVGRCAAAGLKDVEFEMSVEFTRDDLIRGLYYVFGDFVIEQTQLDVGFGCGTFDHSHGSNEVTRESQIADGKVFDRSLSLRAPERVLWNSHL